MSHKNTHTVITIQVVTFESPQLSGTCFRWSSVSTRGPYGCCSCARPGLLFAPQG
jgi:hypothetical protein